MSSAGVPRKPGASRAPNDDTIGDLPFNRDEFCRAASEAVNGREAKIARLDQNSEVTFASLEDQDGEVSMRLVLPNEGGDIVVADDILAVLSESAAEREAVIRRNRLWFDCPKDEFERAAAEIASGENLQR